MDMFSQQAHNIDFERGNRPTPNMEMQEKKTHFATISRIFNILFQGEGE